MSDDSDVVTVLADRFQQGAIYTALSPEVLVAINPFAHREDRDTCLLIDLVGRARAHVAEGLAKSAVVLVAGESGSGKTESTKLMVQHVFENYSRDAGMRRIVSPLLESFGNSATTLNHNSSRFAKLVSLRVDGAHAVVESHVSAHLFERSRVTARPARDRNFHVFYELLAGMAKKDRQSFAMQLGLHGKTASDFNLVRTLNTAVPEAVDATNADRTLRGLAEIGVDAFARRRLLRVLASCLHVGQIEFVPTADDGAAVSVASAASAQLAATLLGVPLSSLKFVLCFRTVNVGGAESIVANQTPELACRVRDSLIRELYQACFAWVVDASNAGRKAAPEQCSLHFLDIMGFERVGDTTNALEQFCVNFANEHLQALFCDKVIRAAKAEYEAELGLDFAFARAEDFDNAPLIDCLSRVFLALDEETILPKGSSLGFTAKAVKLAPALIAPVRFQPAQFSVKHFVGAVVYDTSAFLEQSVERVSEDLLAFVKTTKAPAALVRAPSGRTTGTAFKLELAGLLGVLAGGAHVSFVRCVKSNEAQTAGAFDAALVARQLECSGVLAAMRIARRAFPRRLPLSVLYARYGASVLLAFAPSELALGKSLAFLTEAALATLNRANEARRAVAARTLQRALGRLAAARGLAQRQAACVRVQRTWRACAARRLATGRRACVLTVQRFARLCLCRARAAKACQAAAAWRARFAALERRMRERRLADACVALQRRFRSATAATARAVEANGEPAATDAELVVRLRCELADRDRRVLELEVEVARLREGRPASPPVQLRRTLGALGELVRADTRSAGRVWKTTAPRVGGVLALAQPALTPFKRRADAIADWTLDAIAGPGGSQQENESIVGNNDALATREFKAVTGVEAHARYHAPCPRSDCYETRGALRRLQAEMDFFKQQRRRSPAFDSPRDLGRWGVLTEEMW